MSNSKSKRTLKRANATLSFLSPTLISDDEPSTVIPETPPASPLLVSDIYADQVHREERLQKSSSPVSGEPAGAIILSNAPALLGPPPKAGLSKPKKQKQASGFRFCAARVFLTYPNCNIGKDKLAEKLKEWGADRWIVAEEKHKSGQPHLHAFAFLAKELDTRNERFFDIDGFHPNIKNGEMKRDWKKAVYYCMKAGDYLIQDIELLDTPEGFAKKAQDLRAWKQYVKQKKYSDPVFPFYLPDEKRTAVPKPTASNRKRHVWIVAPPDWGKSYWASVTFANQNVFYPISNSDTPFDHYEDQQVLLFDDFLWKEEHKAMLIDIANVVYNQKHVWGRTRFYPRFWPTGNEPTGVRLMVILDNRVPFNWLDCDWFTSRFNVIDLTYSPKYDPTV